MNPQKESQQSTPLQPTDVTTSNVAQQPVTNSKNPHKKLGLLLLIGPSALILLSIFVYAISNFIFSASQPASTPNELFPEPNLIQSITNTVVFMIGVVAIISWLPGIIIGIILLNKK